MNDNEWRQLVNRALNNDKTAFERLYKETERPVYFLCLKLLGNEQDAMDIVQETYLAAFNGLSTLDDGANFPKWINGISVNQCKRFFRNPTSESLDEKLEHGTELADDESFIPEEYVADSEKRKAIMHIIDSELSEVQRQTIILYYYNGLKTHEIASVMDCPEGTVKYRLNAARAKIKEAVLIYEDKHKERLHTILPVPVLTRILRSEAEHTVVPDIRLFKDTAASAKQLKAGGKATMKNVLTGKVIAAAAAVVVTGGGIAAAVSLNNNTADETISRQNTQIINEQTPDNVDNDSVLSVAADIPESIAESEAEESAAATAIEDSEPEEEEHYINWYGLSMYVPTGFEDAEKYRRMIYKKELDSGTTVYFDYNFLLDYSQVYDIDSYEFEDVPEILKWYIVSDMDEHFDIGTASTFVPNVVDEQVELLGTIFNHQTGSIDVMYCGAPAGEMYYSAYYGLLDLPHYEKVPFSWLCYSDDESTLNELASTVELVAEKISWDEKYD